MIKSFLQLAAKMGIESPKETKMELDSKKLIKIISFIVDNDGGWDMLRPQKIIPEMELKKEEILNFFKNKNKIGVSLIGYDYDEEENSYDYYSPKYITLEGYINEKYWEDYDYDYSRYEIYNNYEIFDIKQHQIIDQNKANTLKNILERIGVSLDSSIAEVESAINTWEQSRVETNKKTEAYTSEYNKEVSEIKTSLKTMQSISIEDAAIIADKILLQFEGGKGALKRLKNSLKNQFTWFEKYWECSPVYIINENEKYGYFLFKEPQGGEWAWSNAHSIKFFDLKGQEIYTTEVV